MNVLGSGRGHRLIVRRYRGRPPFWVDSLLFESKASGHPSNGFVVPEQDVRTVIHIQAATERHMKAFGETRTVGLNSESSGHDVTQ